ASITRSEKKFLTISNVTSGTKTLKVEENGPAVKIFLPKSLQPGQSVAVDFDFQAEVPKQAGSQDLFSQTIDQLNGMLNPSGSSQTQADYGIFSSNKDITNLGMWYPTLSKFD